MLSSRRSFLQQLALGAGAVAFSPLSLRAAGAGRALPRSTPEAEGVSSAGIMAFLDAIARDRHELHSFMMLRHGRVIAEGWWAPYAAGLRHTMYSMSKSFTSTAVGFAVAEGKLRVQDPVLPYFAEDRPDNVSENLAALRIRDLLTMSVGDEKEPTGAVVKTENWVKTFLAAPITHRPGGTFMYNSSASYMLSALVQKVTGQRVVDYLQPRLFEPLGIEPPTWETCPRGINTGGWGLSIQTEGLAKFGQLYLQNGNWNGHQLLPAAWVKEATTFKIQQPPPAQPKRPNEKNDWLQGYCYQFWRCQHGAFRGDGAFGQYTIVMPEQEVVIAMTGESSNMQGELDCVWDHLLPAIQAAPLPSNSAVSGQLRDRLASLALLPPMAQPRSPLEARISGKRFQVEGKEFHDATFEFTEKGCRLAVRDATRSYPIACGREAWELSETAFPGEPPRIISGGTPPAGTKYKIAASGTWRDEQTYEMTWRFYETPHHDTVTCHFDGDNITLSFLSSIAQMRGPKGETRPQLKGKLVS